MTRWLALLLVCLVLNGCSGLSALNLAGSEEQASFTRGIDRYTENGDLTELNLFVQRSPQGEWQTRAAAFVALVEQRDRLQEQLQQRERDLGQCKAEQDALVADRQALEETLERLKQVLIDMELRGQ